MNGRTCRRLFFAGATLFTFLAIVVVYEWSQRVTSWTSPGMRAIQRQYESLHDAAYKMDAGERYAKYGSKHTRLTQMLYGIIRDNLSLRDLRRLAATCGTLPKDEYHWR
jgi:hypothetical protein